MKADNLIYVKQTDFPSNCADCSFCRYAGGDRLNDGMLGYKCIAMEFVGVHDTSINMEENPLKNRMQTCPLRIVKYPALEFSNIN